MLKSLIVISSLAALTACGGASPSKTPTSGSSQQGGDEVDPSKIPTKTAKRSGIRLGPKIAKLCSLPKANFDFDSAALSDSAKTALNALAKCFVDGPAKGKKMSIVGHADPRGDEEYNYALGQERAGKVSEYLASQGLEDERMETTSRGELDATGTDDASWAADRKVEIFLAE